MVEVQQGKKRPTMYFFFVVFIDFFYFRFPINSQLPMLLVFI